MDADDEMWQTNIILPYASSAPWQLKGFPLFNNTPTCLTHTILHGFIFDFGSIGFYSVSKNLNQNPLCGRGRVTALLYSDTDVEPDSDLGTLKLVKAVKYGFGDIFYPSQLEFLLVKSVLF